jgi:formylglycine-generating enzyme required for sulfatase activity
LDRFKQVKEEPPIISKEQNQFIENGSADDTYVPPLDKTPPLKEELEPLYQAIMSAWLNDGEIDEIELERINVSAASLDLEGEKLSAFIQQVYKEHESIIKPVQSYIRLLDQRIDEQITQASPLLSEQLQTLFIDSAKNLGWDEATAKETIQRRIDKKLAILPRPLSLKPLVAGIVLASVIGTGGYVYNQSELTPDEQATQTSEEVEALKPQNSLLTQLGIELVDIPAGSFMMGSNNGDDEKPVHRVTVPAFKMMKHEVTQGQWEAIMGSNPAFFSNCGSKCPIEAISWNDVQTFIQKLNQQTGMNFRLPSEAEWEYAARAGTTTTFSTGDRISTSQANFDGRYTYNGSSEGQYREKTLPVGSFQPNDFGLYDMHGNVWEWTQDCWNESYSGWFSSAPEDASAWLSGDCDKRVLRGGSLSDVPGLLRSANRYGLDAASRSYVYGFRLVQGQ